jgi:hypothetical protein
MKPIRIIYSPFLDKKQAPLQPMHSEMAGYAEVFPEFAGSLPNLEGLLQSILRCIFHQFDKYFLMVKPFLDDQVQGCFIRVVLLVKPGSYHWIDCYHARKTSSAFKEYQYIKSYVPGFDIFAHITTCGYGYRNKHISRSPSKEGKYHGALI